MVVETFGCWDIWSLKHLVAETFCRSDILSFRHLVVQTFGRSDIWSYVDLLLHTPSLLLLCIELLFLFEHTIGNSLSKRILRSIITNSNVLSSILYVRTGLKGPPPCYHCELNPCFHPWEMWKQEQKTKKQNCIWHLLACYLTYICIVFNLEVNPLLRKQEAIESKLRAMLIKEIKTVQYM